MLKKSLQKDWKPKTYLVVNQNGEAFIGLSKGSPVWSTDWSEAKELKKENTTLLVSVYKAEIVEI